MEILDGEQLSNKIKSELKSEIKELMIKPCIAVIQVGNNEKIKNSIENKKKICSDVGMYFKHIDFDEFATEKEIINKIIELNNDEYVDGITIQLPLPLKFNEKKLVNFITKNKDIDGLTDSNKANLIKKTPNLIPCVPASILELLKEYKIQIEGKHVVIVGRSDLVGMPLFCLMNIYDATITLCNSKTDNLSDYTKQADILVSATGVDKLITKDMVKKGSTVIDVGYSLVDGKIISDVDYDNVKGEVDFITPPSTINTLSGVMLLKNALIAKNKRTTKL